MLRRPDFGVSPLHCFNNSSFLGAFASNESNRARRRCTRRAASTHEACAGPTAHLVQVTVRCISECSDNYKHILGYDYDFRTTLNIPTTTVRSANSPPHAVACTTGRREWRVVDIQLKAARIVRATVRIFTNRWLRWC